MNDFDNYVPKCVPEFSKGFIKYNIERIDHRDNVYRVTFKDGLLTPGVVVPDNLGFKPETDMKVIWDNDGSLGSEGYLSFYDQQGKQLCALHKERSSAVWQNITQDTLGEQLKEKLDISDSVKLTSQMRKTGEKVLEEYGHIPTMDEIDANFKEADRLEKEAKQLRAEATLSQNVKNILVSSGQRRIKRYYGYILKDKEELAKSEGEDAKKLDAKIKNTSEEIEKAYERINPKLAALRKQERDKVENGMDPKKAQKERREAVKAYYNKKQTEESR